MAISAHRGTTGLLVLALTVVLLTLTAKPALAHDQLVASVPAAGGALGGPPREVRLTFTTAVAPQFSQVAVTSPDGIGHSRGKPRVDGAALIQPLDGTGPAGVWHVAYRIVSSDGHPVSDSYTFTVQRGASSPPAPASSEADERSTPPASAAPAPQQQPAADAGAASTTVVALAAAGLGLCAAGALWTWRRRRP
jgi:methionine-rich copper-binding protein CopC